MNTRIACRATFRFFLCLPASLMFFTVPDAGADQMPPRRGHRTDPGPPRLGKSEIRRVHPQCTGGRMRLRVARFALYVSARAAQRPPPREPPPEKRPPPPLGALNPPPLRPKELGALGLR